MGDFRTHIKIEFSMGDFEDEVDFSINWSPCNSEADGVDQGVIDWFREAGAKGMAMVRENVAEGAAASLKAHHEREERAEYERLKQKFEP